MYLTVDSLKERNSILTGLNNITLRKVDIKPNGYDKMYMGKDLSFIRQKISFTKQYIDSMEAKLCPQSFIQYPNKRLKKKKKK